MTLDVNHTALVIVDPDEKFVLEENGKTWDLMESETGCDRRLPRLVQLRRVAGDSGVTIIYLSHYDPDMIRNLRERNIDVVILVNLTAKMPTRVGLRYCERWGVEVILVEDAASSPGPECTQVAYSQFERLVSQVVSTEDMITRINEAAKQTV